MRRINIITPTFNASAHIQACVQSVAGQDHENFRHYIFDGGSSDDTAEIVRGLQKKYSWLEMIVARDNGVYDAMNKGISRCESGWIYFLGADDRLYADNTLSAVDPFLIPGSGVVYGDVLFKGSDKLYDGKFSIDKILARNVCHQAMFFEVDAFADFGGYDLKYRLLADYTWNLRWWLSRPMLPRYCAVIVARYADGGLSSADNDEAFRSDYPDICLSSIDAFPGSPVARARRLASVFRKILLRYGRKFLRQTLATRNRPGDRLALSFMYLSSGYFLVRKFLRR